MIELLEPTVANPSTGEEYALANQLQPKPTLHLLYFEPLVLGAWALVTLGFEMQELGYTEQSAAAGQLVAGVETNAAKAVVTEAVEAEAVEAEAVEPAEIVAEPAGRPIA